MDHNLQSGTPVDLNALTMGEKNRPEGSQVIRVSNQGMLLYCEPDNLSGKISKGDSVDIHLTVQHNDEQKKLTIPSLVRHVVGGSLDVEFLHPDPVLLDLIESYRTSDTHQLEAVVSIAQTGQDSPGVIPLPEQPPPGKAKDQPPPSPGVSASQRYLLIPGLIILSVLSTILIGIYFNTNGLQQRLSALEIIAVNRDSEFASMQNKLFSASLLEGRYASLDARISALGNTVSDIDLQLRGYTAGSNPAEVVNTQPTKTPPAAEKDLEASPAPQTPELTADTTEISDNITVQASRPVSLTATPEQVEEPVIQPATTVSEKVTPVTPTHGTGPWVINLMSSRDRTYLESVARKAHSSSIPTELNSAIVKGKKYWRLQVAGFTSLAEAKSRAGEIRQTMGIGDVWFLKRKPGT